MINCPLNNMNEAEIRVERIDSALKAAGWGVGQGSRVREYPITLDRIEGHGHEIADLGKPAKIQTTFSGFQKYLCTQAA